MFNCCAIYISLKSNFAQKSRQRNQKDPYQLGLARGDGDAQPIIAPLFRHDSSRPRHIIPELTEFKNCLLVEIII
jgi:hypothetical protein